jgi:hypothetical protein
MAAKLENCAKEKQQSVTLFCWQRVYKVDKFISACVLPLVELCMNGLKYVKMAVWVWLMQSAQVVQPQPQLHRMKKELGNWFFMNLQFHKVRARWVPKRPTNEHKCIHLRHLFLPLGLLLQRRWQFSAMECHRWWNLGSPLSIRNQAEEHAIEASVTSCCKEIQDVTIGKVVHVGHLLGFSRAYSWDLHGTWKNCQKCNES